MIDFIIPLLGSYLDVRPFLVGYIYPAFALAVLCVIPHLIRLFIEWR